MAAYLLKQARIADGTGLPVFTGDVRLEGDCIAAVGHLGATADDTVIDCTGLLLTPGMIDIHNHSEHTILAGDCDNYIFQGVTTVTGGNCGTGAYPVQDDALDPVHFDLSPAMTEKLLACRSFDDYNHLLDQSPLGLNIANLMGNGSIRWGVMGYSDARPTPAQLNDMLTLTQQGMQAGFFGLSSGLAYVPSKHADTDELIALCSVVGRYNGIYATHMRNQADFILDAISEAAVIGRRSGTRVEISHLKATKSNTGLSVTELAMLEQYNRCGVEVNFDVYPHVRSGANLVAKIRKQLSQPLEAYLADPTRDGELNEAIRQVRGGKWNELIIRDFPPKRDYEGMSIDDIARHMQTSCTQAVISLLRLMPQVVIAAERSMEDLVRLARHPLAIAGSDGRCGRFGGHPRSFDSFTRFLREYVLDDKHLKLEHGVRMMTSLPAWKLRIHDRGLVRPGMRADIAVMDLDALRYTADYKNPYSLSQGVEYLFINGTPVLKGGEITRQYAGRRLVFNG